MFSFVEPHVDVGVHCHLYSYGLVNTHKHKYAWRMRRCREDEVSVVCRNEHGQMSVSIPAEAGSLSRMLASLPLRPQIMGAVVLPQSAPAPSPVSRGRTGLWAHR